MRRAPLLVVLVLVSACSSGGGGGAGVGSAESVTQPIATTTTTTAAPTTTVPLEPASTPDQAARSFMDAWRNADSASASTIALPLAVFSAFGVGIPSSFTDRGCMTGGFDPTQCVYRTDLGEVQVRATKYGGGWIVDQVSVSPG